MLFEDFKGFLKVAFLIILAFFILYLLFHTAGNVINTIAPPTPTPANTFANLELQAKAAVVYDLGRNEVLYGKNQSDILPIASITKIMTAYTALALVPPDTIITIRPEDVQQEGDSGLLSGERFKLADLIKLMLVSSSNDAASAVAAGVEKNTDLNFVLAMNNYGNQMGLLNTRFRNSSGLDEQENVVSGSYSTANDIAKMFTYVYQHKPEVFVGTKEPFAEVYSQDGFKHLVYNTDSALGQIPNVLASKTGTTNLAGGSLAVMFKPALDRTMVVVVLGSTPTERYTDVLKLTTAVISQFKADNI